MPNYNFKNRETGEVVTTFMSMAEAEEYEKANPHMEWLPSQPAAIVDDPMKLDATRRKPDEDFRSRLKQIRKAHYGSNINTW